MTRRSRRTFALAAALLTVAAALMMESIGPNQNGHLALVRAFEAGRPYIYRGETGDAVFRNGHFYARKAPGLAMFSVPWSEGLRATGLDSGSRGPTAVWKLNLFGAVLPFVVLLFLMRNVAERVVPGYGAQAALLLGAGTLLFPFATLFFAHALSATLGFAAFVLLQLERKARHRVWLVAVAGLVVGFAVVAEYTLLVVAALLGVAVLAGSNRLVRIAAYAGGFAVGILPLLAFNLWAFGSATELNYDRGLTGNAAITGVYGAHLPSLRALLSLVLSNKGLFVLMPLTAIAFAGLRPLWVAGHRWAALLCGAIPLTYVVWDAGFVTPLGGSTPGPRYLIPALPFLALPLAAALRIRPLLVASLGVVSAAVMLLATVTEPMTGDQGLGFWIHLLKEAAFMKTVSTPLGLGHGWLAIARVGVLFVTAVALAVGSLPSLRADRSDVVVAAGATLAWLVLAVIAAPLLPISEFGTGTTAGALAVLLVAVTVAAGVYLGARRGPLDLVPFLPLALLVLPHLTAHPRWCLLIAGGTLCVATAVWTRPRWFIRSSRPAA